MAAAKDVFERLGWSGTTMRAVADQAGVSVKTVEALYRTKAELLKGGRRLRHRRGCALRSDPRPRIGRRDAGRTRRDNSARLDTADCGYLGSTEMVRNPRAVAHTGANGTADCGVTFRQPGTWNITATLTWRACWAVGVQDGPPALQPRPRRRPQRGQLGL